MYIDELIDLFGTAATGFPALKSERVTDGLRRAIEGRKYDLQDEALIEVILRQDSRDLVESFTEAYGSALNRFNDEAARTEFLDGGGAEKEAIRIYIASLEHLINYYHTSLIGKHFSST
ncbi:MAG TPA: hypothetical protein VLG45_06350 [Thermodesulfobacteriota bacterium]|nr:hypothetical protein [Thermodesulfobacteriota bacterium]